MIVQFDSPSLTGVIAIEQLRKTKNFRLPVFQALPGDNTEHGVVSTESDLIDPLRKRLIVSESCVPRSTSQIITL